MKNKKIITMLLAFAMAVSFCACSKTEDADEVQASSETSIEATIEATAETLAETSAETSVESLTEVTTELPAETTISDNVLPIAYQDIITRTGELIDNASEGEIDNIEGEEAFWGVVEEVLAFGSETSRELICYAVTDINGDATDELIIASKVQMDPMLEYTGPVHRAGYSILCVYTLDGDEAVLLAGSYSRASWFINSDGQFVFEGSSGAAYHDLYVYELGANSVDLDELYHLYTDYVEDTMEVVLIESAGGAPDTILLQTDDPANSDIWDVFDSTREEYTIDMLELDLIPVYGAF